MEIISVFLADWQVLFREGIHFTLSGEEDFNVIGESTGNEEALELVKKNPPRIAIVNINHSDFSGIAFARSIRQDMPQVSVILVMDTDDEDQLYAALKSGAAACVAKDIDPEELVSIIRQTADGVDLISRAILKPGITRRILDDFESYSLLNKETDNLLASLTTRENDILSRITKGETMEDIIPALGMSEEIINLNLDVIRKKVVSNEHSRDVVEASQKGLASVIKRTTRRSKVSQEYITRQEFESFRESLKELFKSVLEK